MYSATKGGVEILSIYLEPRHLRTSERRREAAFAGAFAKCTKKFTHNELL